LTGCDGWRESAPSCCCRALRALRRSGIVAHRCASFGLDELDSSSSVLPIRVDILRHRGSLEAIERREDLTAEQCSGTRSWSRKKSTYPLKFSNNAKKSRYLANVSLSALTHVVPPDALKREAEPVRDLPEAPTSLVDHLPSIAFPGKTIMPPIVYEIVMNALSQS
jgi:hypothetical protein